MPTSLFFKQQKGLWERRGAPLSWIELATDRTPEELTTNVQQDSFGYTVWHYWANAKHPQKHWKTVRNIIGNQIDDLCASNGEHPFHRLCLNEHIEAAVLWATHAHIPQNATMASDTFWHSIAWSGNLNLLNTVSAYLSADNINDVDEHGMTPVMIAMHRGSFDFVKAFLFLGADPNICDEQNKNLLHHAAIYGDISVYTELQDFGADETIRSDRGLTPSALLNESKHSTSTSNTATKKMYWQKKWLNKLPL